MGLKEAYQEKVDAQLKVWSAEFKELQAKAEMAKADAKIELAKAEAKIELQKHLQNLQAKQEVAQQKLKELKEAGADAWEKAKPDLEKAIDNLKSAWESIKKR